MNGNPNSSDPRSSDSSGFGSNREILSFIEPRPPLITNPWMRPKPTHGTNLLPQFEDTVIDEENDPDYVKVYLRIKPASENVSDMYQVQTERALLTIAADKNLKIDCKVSKMYYFSHIFDRDTTQKDIFDNVVKHNLAQLPKGSSHTLLTYGSSGSGKTYTLMGTVAQPGLIPRSLEYLFKNINSSRYPKWKPKDGSIFEKLTQTQQVQELQVHSKLRRPQTAAQTYKRMSVRLSSDFQSLSNINAEEKHCVWVSFAEIYNESIYDLLSAREKYKAPTRLRIYEDTKGNANIKGLTQVYVRTGAEAYDVMLHGQQNLKFAETGVHSHSSRSHCIFTVTLITYTEGGQPSLSCLRLCDLAGSERASKTGNSGERMQESRSINMSLHVLERCLHTLRRRQHNATQTTCKVNDTTTGRNALNKGSLIVPYRESKLTRLLGSSLSGASGETIAMVVNINPQRRYFEETQHVLQLSAIARKLFVDTCVQEIDVGSSVSAMDSDCSYNYEMEKLKHENERLHFEIDSVHRELEEVSTRVITLQSEHGKQLNEVLQEANDICKSTYDAECQLLKEIHNRKEKECHHELKHWKRKYWRLYRRGRQNKRFTVSEGEELDSSHDASDVSSNVSFDSNEDNSERLQRKVAEQADVIQKLSECNKALTENKRIAAVFQQEAEDLRVKLVSLQQEHEKLQRCYDDLETQLLEPGDDVNKHDQENAVQKFDNQKLNDDAHHQDDDAHHQDDDAHHQDDDAHHQDDDAHHQDDDAHHQDDDAHHQDDDAHHQDDDAHHQDDDAHHQDDDAHHQDDDAHHQDDDAHHQDDDAHHQDDDAHHQDDDAHHQDDDSGSEYRSSYIGNDEDTEEEQIPNRDDVSLDKEDIVFIAKEQEVVMLEDSDEIFSEDEETIGVSSFTLANREAISIQAEIKNMRIDDDVSRKSLIQTGHNDRSTKSPVVFIEPRMSVLRKISDEVNGQTEDYIGRKCANNTPTDSTCKRDTRSGMDTNYESKDSSAMDNNKCGGNDPADESQEQGTEGRDEVSTTRQSCDSISGLNRSVHLQEAELNDSGLSNDNKEVADGRDSSCVYEPVCQESMQEDNTPHSVFLREPQTRDRNTSTTTSDNTKYIRPDGGTMVQSECDLEESIVLEHKDVSMSCIQQVHFSTSTISNVNIESNVDEEEQQLHLKQPGNIDSNCSDEEVEFRTQDTGALEDLTNRSGECEHPGYHMSSPKPNLQPLWQGARTTERPTRSTPQDENRPHTFQTEKKVKRRQLWTPRVCDEAGQGAGQGEGEESPVARLVVPRPSYHRPRRTRRNNNV